MVSTIEACSAGTATLTCGRASATTSPAMASPASTSGTWRRQPGRRGTTEGAVGAAAKAERGPAPPPLRRAT